MARTATTSAELPSSVVQALRYGPSTQQAIQRSQYLTDALRSMQESSTAPQSLGEVAAKLGATYLYKKGLDKANSATLAALKSERDTRIGKARIGFDKPAMPSPGTPPIAPPRPETPTEPPTMAAPPPPAPVQVGPLAPAMSPEDRLAIGRMVWGEARGEPAEGQLAAAAVALNRARERGQPVSQVIAQPKQFDGYNDRSRSLDEAALAPVFQNIDPLLRGEIPDPTGGADHFHNPAMANPGWGQGKPGQMIGQHRFLNLEQGRAGPQAAPAPQPPAAAPPQNLAQPGPIADQPFQVAAAGGLQPGMIPSGPGPSVPGQGGAPVVDAVPPQAAAPMAGAAPSTMRYWQPTPAQVQYLNGLLDSTDPLEQDRGVALSQEWRAKMAEPVAMEQATVNGVPVFYDPRDPAGTLQPMQIPGALQNRTVNAQDLGIAAPPGTIMSASPTGRVETVLRPEAGQQVVSGPGQAYREAPIPGAKTDPLGPASRLDAMKSFRGEVKPILDDATLLKRNIDAVRTGYSQQNGSGDIAMVNGLQKLIDEGVVREGDVALQLKSQGIEGGIAGALAFIQSSGKFSPEIRQKIMGTANQLYGSLNTTYRERALAYKGIVERTYGEGAFNDVIPPETQQALEWTGAAPGGPAPGGGAPPPAPPPKAPISAQSRATMERLQQQGRFDPKAPLGSQANPFVPRDAQTLQRLDTPQNRGKYVVMPDGSIGVIE